MTRLQRVHRLSTTTRMSISWYDSTTPGASIEQYNRVSISLWLDYAVVHRLSTKTGSVHFIAHDSTSHGVHWLSSTTECPFHYDSTTPVCIDWALQPSVHFFMTRLRRVHRLSRLQPNVHFIMTRLRRVHRLSTTTECPFHYDSTTPCA